MLGGIDVSHYNGRFAWGVSDAAFAGIKATEGTSVVDAQLPYNLSSHGTRVAILYHFASGGDPRAEADHFLTQWKPGNAIALDVEANLVKTAACVAWAKTWLDYVAARTGVRPLLYISDDTLTKYNWSSCTGYPLWVARYGPSPVMKWWAAWTIWQYNDVPTDLDYFAGAAADLTALAGQAAAAAVSTTEDDDMTPDQITSLSECRRMLGVLLGYNEPANTTEAAAMGNAHGLYPMVQAATLNLPLPYPAARAATPGQTAPLGAWWPEILADLTAAGQLKSAEIDYGKLSAALEPVITQALTAAGSSADATAIVNALAARLAA